MKLSSSCCCCCSFAALCLAHLFQESEKRSRLAGETPTFACALRSTYGAVNEGVVLSPLSKLTAGPSVCSHKKDILSSSLMGLVAVADSGNLSSLLLLLTYSK